MKKKNLILFIIDTTRRLNGLPKHSDQNLDDDYSLLLMDVHSKSVWVFLVHSMRHDDLSIRNEIEIRKEESLTYKQKNVDHHQVFCLNDVDEKNSYYRLSDKLHKKNFYLERSIGMLFGMNLSYNSI